MWRFMFGSCNLDWSIFQVISMLTYLLKCVTLSIYSNLKKKISPKKWLSKSSLCILLKNVHGLHLANGIGERNGYTKSDFRARLESAERIGLTRFFFIFFLPNTCHIWWLFNVPSVSLLKNHQIWQPKIWQNIPKGFSNPCVLPLIYGIGLKLLYCYDILSLTLQPPRRNPEALQCLPKVLPNLKWHGKLLH